MAAGRFPSRITLQPTSTSIAGPGTCTEWRLAGAGVLITSSSIRNSKDSLRGDEVRRVGECRADVGHGYGVVVGHLLDGVARCDGAYQDLDRHAGSANDRPTTLDAL